MERTTNLQKLRDGQGFTWGELIKIHEIGEYSIVEYHEWKTKGSNVLVGDTDYTKTSYHHYVNGWNCSRSTDSLDAALAGCIAYKHDGANSQAGTLFIKMVTRKED